MFSIVFPFYELTLLPDLRGLWLLDKFPVIIVLEKTALTIGLVDHRLGYNLITYRALLSLQLMLE